MKLEGETPCLSDQERASGLAPVLRAGQAREPVLAAWGIGEEGGKVLLHLMAGSKEDTETVRAFFQDMRGRGLGDPLLVVSDGAPGIIRAIEECFPRSARQPNGFLCWKPRAGPQVATAIGAPVADDLVSAERRIRASLVRSYWRVS